MPTLGFSASILVSGLAGGNSLEQALVDTVAETITEMRDKLFPFVMKPDGAEKVIV